MRLSPSAVMVGMAFLVRGNLQEGEPALLPDDECSANDTGCSLNALQLRSQKVTAEEADATTWGTCAQYGCGSYGAGRPCQCNSRCKDARDCCWDYASSCAGHEYNPAAQTTHDSCFQSGNIYTLNWEAEGDTFFDKFTFVSQDDVHGAHQFTNKSEAEKHKTISLEGGRAQLRFGGLREPSFDGEAWKRYSVNIHTDTAWNPYPGFVAALHYSRLPYGCGVWPSFWAMNSDEVWPKGGELDILEYANYEENKITFHISEKCQLDEKLMEHCKPHGSSKAHSSNCETNYFENKLGCMPKQKQQGGWRLAKSPGIIAAEWSEDNIRVFHIPEAEIPEDLKEDRPNPSTWGRWMIAYLPFKPGCRKFIGPQELVLNMQLCGDWAGSTWQLGDCQARTGKYAGPMCEAGLSSPTDCCTKYVTSHIADFALRHEMMDIKSLKVYTANGAVSKESGTFVRGGIPLAP